MSNNEPNYSDNLYFGTSQSPRNYLATKPQAIDLTEQWKQKKLPLGWYFVKDEAGKIDYAEYMEWFNADGWCGNYFGCEEEIVEVLAEAPDYIEWKNMVNCACEEHKANTELLEEKAELKDLLKECRDVLYLLQGETVDFPHTVDDMITKIDEVLK